MDNLWVFIAGILVFFMQAGFALVEAGLLEAKRREHHGEEHCRHVHRRPSLLCRRLRFRVWRWWGWFIGGNSYFLSGSSLFEITDGLSGATDFFFQVVFAATAVTIASGAMAGRTKFSAYLMFAGLMTAFIYPVVVHWTWGGGLIAEYINWGDAGSYSDFAGSGIVTSPVVSQHIWAPKLSDLESANTTKTANHEPYLATTSCIPSSVS